MGFLASHAAIGRALFGAPGGGAPSFTPADLSPVVWLDATQESFANNDPCGQLTDWSGNANHFTSSGGARPTFKTSGINSRPAFEADGTDDFSLSPSIAAADSWWGFIAFQPVTMGSGKELWSITDFPSGVGLYRLLETNGATTININQSLGPMPSSITLADGVTRVIFVCGKRTEINYQADNGSLISITGLAGDYPSTASDGSRIDSAMRLFARGDPALYFNVRVGELIYGTGELTSDQQTAVWTYLSDKWNTSIP